MTRVSELTVRRFIPFACVFFGGVVHAVAAACPGNTDAIGTSRIITASVADFPKVGTEQYGRAGALPLTDYEIVLTFDDGPLSPYTTSVLQTLASECVRATFFMVGRQATANPALVRQIHAAGHVVATHSQNHPLTFNQMSPERAQREVSDGIDSVAEALGDRAALAPWFRIPGLLRNKPVEDYLASRGVAVWSVDFDADDWKEISADDVIARALERIGQKKRGVLLLHDVQPATALALPRLLKELKTRGYRIVHAVPPGGEREMVLPPVAASAPARAAWPRIAEPANEATAARSEVLRPDVTSSVKPAAGPGEPAPKIRLIDLSKPGRRPPETLAAEPAPAPVVAAPASAKRTAPAHSAAPLPPAAQRADSTPAPAAPARLKPTEPAQRAKAAVPASAPTPARSKRNRDDSGWVVGPARDPLPGELETARRRQGAFR